jgi:oxygen-independent coproporphyrinogen-3 oxidase
MSFGVYIHIPYCLQRCTYCDFATYEIPRPGSSEIPRPGSIEKPKIMPTDDYVELVKQEIRTRRPGLKVDQIDTIYFGGGTPSLLRPDQIISLIQELENEGLRRSPDCEITIEINPATLSAQNLIELMKFGVNRFSVGAQTFDDRLLKSVHREHNADQTRETLALLSEWKVNYSADLLFALPTQDFATLQDDVRRMLDFRPPHISPYCLTVPEGHALSKGRPLDEVQLEMFRHIDEKLVGAGYERYEISNYALPGFHSRHNSLYWQDQPYWGLGLSAHSFVKDGEFGVRFWNASNIKVYEQQILTAVGEKWDSLYAGLPADQFEQLVAHEALTDFCHTSLRTSEGLDRDLLEQKFGPAGWRLVAGPLAQLESEQLVRSDGRQFKLSADGVFVSNAVFRELTFLAEEWDRALRAP